MIDIFNKLGIRFQYPKNWTLDEQDALEGEESVSVYSPGGGFWSIRIHPFDDEPDQLCQSAVKAMQQIYDELDFEPSSDEILGVPLAGYDMNFYCLDLTNTAHVRSIRGNMGTYVIMYQADDREFDTIEPVFQAITASFIQAELQNSADD